MGGHMVRGLVVSWVWGSVALTFFVLREIPWRKKKGRMSFAGRLWEWRPVDQLMVLFAGISMPFFSRA